MLPESPRKTVAFLRPKIRILKNKKAIIAEMNIKHIVDIWEMFVVNANIRLIIMSDTPPAAPSRPSTILKKH